MFQHFRSYFIFRGRTRKFYNLILKPNILRIQKKNKKNIQEIPLISFSTKNEARQEAATSQNEETWFWTLAVDVCHWFLYENRCSCRWIKSNVSFLRNLVQFIHFFEKSCIFPFKNFSELFGVEEIICWMKLCSVATQLSLFKRDCYWTV